MQIGEATKASLIRLLSRADEVYETFGDSLLVARPGGRLDAANGRTWALPSTTKQIQCIGEHIDKSAVPTFSVMFSIQLFQFRKEDHGWRIYCADGLIEELLG